MFLPKLKLNLRPCSAVSLLKQQLITKWWKSLRWQEAIMLEEIQYKDWRVVRTISLVLHCNTNASICKQTKQDVVKSCRSKICPTKMFLQENHSSHLLDSQQEGLKLKRQSNTDQIPSNWQAEMLYSVSMTTLLSLSPLLRPVLSHWGFLSNIEFETKELSASCKQQNGCCSLCCCYCDIMAHGGLWGLRSWAEFRCSNQKDSARVY